ncbi:uncharacterized protein LOC18428750 isoform X2 [Amborella trichopoda]|uniref:uncharacterized protein LOC18428750 isoform X2 n=1 Tax=Amborella trichopoda TaxID=13333 RepID=UPI0009BED3FF|nr:uncharacterized protein LOC18428750 isoform X2 [Amborella trichopoda]|eukprot:XP_020519666.1 uncharacterized protein LOC18428750 isoform X2 [Amborella trichopoda]
MDEVLVAGDGRPFFFNNNNNNTTTPSSSSSPVSLSNLPLLSSFLAFAIAQFLKLFTTRYKEKRWDAKRLLGSGGMPSSHAATVTALAIAIGLREGAGSSMFALAVVVASVVMYDASGVRLHAGRQAEYCKDPRKPIDGNALLLTFCEGYPSCSLEFIHYRTVLIY